MMQITCLPQGFSPSEGSVKTDCTIFIIMIEGRIDKPPLCPGGTETFLVGLDHGTCTDPMVQVPTRPASTMTCGWVSSWLNPLFLFSIQISPANPNHNEAKRSDIWPRLQKTQNIKDTPTSPAPAPNTDIQLYGGLDFVHRSYEQRHRVAQGPISSCVLWWQTEG